MIAEAELNSAGVRLRPETSIYAMECSENTANGPPFIETPQILGGIHGKTALLHYFRPNAAPNAVSPTFWRTVVVVCTSEKSGEDRDRYF